MIQNKKLNMAKTKITSYDQLHQHIAELVSEREKTETLIVNEVMEIYNLVQNPGILIKRTVSDLASDKNFRTDILKIGVSLTSNIISGRMSGTASGIGSIVSFLLKKVSGDEGKFNLANLGGFISKLIPWKKS
jgi:hypothetical protein